MYIALYLLLGFLVYFLFLWHENRSAGYINGDDVANAAWVGVFWPLSLVIFALVLFCVAMVKLTERLLKTEIR